MADKTVYVKVGAKVDGAVTGLHKVRRSLDDLAKADLTKPQKAFDGLSSKAVKVDGAVAGLRKLRGSLDDLAKADLKTPRQSLEELSSKAASVDPPVAGLAKIKAGLDDLTKADLKTPKEAFDELSDKAAVAGAVVALGLGKAVASFAEFDAAMSAVGANSGAAGAQLDALREQAIKLGSETSFSATEAAQGINELAKAGVSTAEILNGGLKGALDLAAAGQIGVAEAAETTASALNQFELNGDKAGHVADLLANAANAAQGGVDDMGAALGMAGVAAHAAGLNIDETTTLLGLFAKAGMTGSDAGTSLKTMMQRLSAPTEKAAGTLEELGVAAYDAQGNFVGAESLITQLSEATKDMSTESKMAAFNVIFGADAIRAASIAASAGAEGYKAMNAEVTKAGGAAENAAKLTDNLKGDIERLGGSLETAFISGGSAANGALRSLTTGIGGVVDVVSKLPAPLLLGGAGLAALALVLPKGISTYRNFTKSLDAMGLSMAKLTARSATLGLALRGLGGAVAGLAIVAAIGAISNSFTELSKIEFDPKAIEDGTVSLADFNKKMAETNDLGLPIATTLSDFGQVLEATFDPGKGQQIDSFFATLNSNLGFENTSDVEVAGQRFKELDAALSGLVAAGKGEAAARMFKEVTDAAAAQGVSVDEVRSKLPGYAQALVDAGSAAAAAGPKLGDMSEDVKAVEEKADDAKKALDELRTTLEGFGSPLAAQRAAQREYVEAVNGVKDALKDQKDELVKNQLELLKIEKPTKAQTRAAERWADAQIKAGKGLDLSTDAGRKNQAALDSIRDATLKAASSTFDLTHSQDLTAAAVAKGRIEFIRQATQMGLTKTEAGELADQMGLIPKNVKTAIGLSGVETTKAKLDAVTGKVTILDKKTAKPKITPQLNGVQMDLAEARLNTLARGRTALITPRFTNVVGAVPGDFIGGRGGTRAGGGPIVGAGTGTSDTAGIFALSNGEHVLTAAEVTAAGGHAAIYALRKAILSGGLTARAAGGPAARSSAYRAAHVTITGSRGPTAAEIGAAVAAHMGPQIGTVYGGPDTLTAVRQGLRDYDWQVGR